MDGLEEDDDGGGRFQSWPSTLLIVSHDRIFLTTVATDIVHMHSKHLHSYRGNYEDFEKAKEEKLKQQQKEYEAQQQLRAHAQVALTCKRLYHIDLMTACSEAL